MSSLAVNYWLQRFALEVRKVSGEHYSPDSLHQICCGMQRALRAAGRVGVNFFDSRVFTPFRDVLDGELKRLHATGEYVHKRKAVVIGDHSPQTLVDTICGLPSGLFLCSNKWGGT